MSDTLAAISSELASLVERAGRQVAGVQGHGRIPSSGIWWRPGVIVTAAHALRRDDDLRVTLADGRTVPAELAGRDPGTDIAVLRVDDPGSQPGWIEATAAPRAGEIVVAVGYTRNTGVSAVGGLVSGVGAEWNTWPGGRLDRFIRLDLNLYPGLSGSAVVNAAGQLLGVATAGLSRTSPLAIPISTLTRVAKDLAEKGYIARGYLGIGLQPIGISEHLRTKLNLAQDRGLIALSVEPDGPAGQARMAMGDVLLTLDGTPIQDTAAVQAVLRPENIGRTLRASILRGGAPLEIAIVVGERPRRNG